MSAWSLIQHEIDPAASQEKIRRVQRGKLNPAAERRTCWWGVGSGGFTGSGDALWFLICGQGWPALTVTLPAWD
jgi:hypothetical protein